MPKPRIATKRTLTDLHKEIGALLRTAKAAVQDALDGWERIQGLKGPPKRQALADINESLERRRYEMRRFFARIDLTTPIAALSAKT